MLVVFEGPDGCGKSTQIELFRKALDERDVTHEALRDPGTTPIGERIREVLLDPDLSRQPETELLLFTAARAELVNRIKRSSMGNDVLILDRWVLSTFVYQGLHFRDYKILSTHRAYNNSVMPDLLIYLSVDPVTALNRVQASGRDLDYFEQKGPDYFAKICRRYDRYAEEGERYGWLAKQVMWVDGSRSIDTIHTGIMENFSKIFEKPPEAQACEG